MYLNATFKGEPGNTVHCFELDKSYVIWFTVGHCITISPVHGMLHTSGAPLTEVRQYTTLKSFLSEWQIN